METLLTVAAKTASSVPSANISNSADGVKAPVKSRRERLALNASIVFVGALILLAFGFGIFRPVDDWLQEVRFNLLDRPPTGDVVFVEIDAASLKSVGVWPWPRTVHATMVDRLMELGAKSVTFDIDFSAASTKENDDAFATALQRAGGFAALGAFEQSGGVGGGKVVNTPIAPLAEASGLVSVDVPLGAGNLVRDYPTSRLVGTRRIASLGSALGGNGLLRSDTDDALFGLNFAINLNAVNRISAVDVLTGTVAGNNVNGRDVIVGASAQELRDFFATPRFGLIPGGLVHALAAETLLQGIAMHDVPWQAMVGLVTTLAFIAAILGPRLSRRRWLFCVMVVLVGVELGSFWLQRTYALRVYSATIHIALMSFVLAAIISDLRLRRWQYAQATRARESMRAMLQQVITDDFDGVIIVDEGGKILANSRMAMAFLTQSSEQTSVPGLPQSLANLLIDCFASAPSAQTPAPMIGQLSMPVANSGMRYLDYVVTLSSLDNEHGHRVACLTFRDVTERKAAQDRLTFLASFDPSTGAWLQRELITKMETLNSNPNSSSMALILVELRQFGTIASSFGDAVGERLLQAVVSRLRNDGYEMVARIGDSNFGICVPDLSDPSAVLKISQLLIDGLTEPYAIGDHKITVGVDLGVAISNSSLNAEAILGQARIAQAAARCGPVNRFEIFLPRMQSEFTEREWLQTALRQALAQGQFTLDYQPQFDLASGACFGAEALIRWRHPERGLISPGIFIPIAEESQLIVDIGRWVMRTACAEAAFWPDHLGVSVNVSPLQLGSRELLTDVVDALERVDLTPTRLTIEITESAFVSRAGDTVTLLNTLRAQGISVSLDDFGVGYSSLGYLDRLPFDEIKIDQSFVKRILDDRGAAIIVQSVLQLASKLGKKLVAEGVETAAQAQFLQNLGCRSVQGYYFGRPMSAADFRKQFASSNEHVSKFQKRRNKNSHSTLAAAE